MDKSSFFKGIRSSEKGFTLMEMLGIVAIVSILAGFFFMANRSSSEEAKNMQIKSSMNETMSTIERYLMAGGAVADAASSQQVLAALQKTRDVYGSLLTDPAKVEVEYNAFDEIWYVEAPLIRNGALTHPRWCVTNVGVESECEE
ncbi:MAG: prepilin-type N-terminal cleavage/methylation domain-containing protein [Candidatus Paceibacterota bacterium]|jgi:Tfp pilus assembly protein PilE